MYCYCTDDFSKQQSHYHNWGKKEILTYQLSWPILWLCHPLMFAWLQIYMSQISLISGQNDFNLGWFVISLSFFMIMNTKYKEITNQPRLKSFWPEIKFNLQHILQVILVLFLQRSWCCFLSVLPDKGNVGHEVISVVVWPCLYHCEVKYGLIAAAWSAFTCWRLTSYQISNVKVGMSVVHSPFGDLRT